MAESKLDPNIRLLRQVAVTTLLWATTFVLSKGDWLGHPTSLPLRITLAVVGIGGFLPIVLVYAKSIRMQDEFNQRLHLIALAAAFAVTAAVSYSADILVQAGFIPQLPATGVWALMIGLWFVGMLMASRFYR